MESNQGEKHSHLQEDLKNREAVSKTSQVKFFLCSLRLKRKFPQGCLTISTVLQHPLSLDPQVRKKGSNYKVIYHYKLITL